MKYLILALSLLLASTSAIAEESKFETKEKKVYLYMFFHDDNSVGETFRTEMEDMGQCLAVISKSKLTMPTSAGGDYEALGAMWCGGDMQRNFNSNWFKDKETDLTDEKEVN